MRYSGERKQQTQARILEEAIRAFREEGMAGIGIADLMSRAGLTHGGFYAHFESKDALAAEVCNHALDESVEKLMAVAAITPPGERVRTVVRNYLNRTHRDDPATGCPIPALAGDVSREPAPVRHAFAEALKRYFVQVGSVIAGGNEAADPDDALVLVSGMAGAMLLARAVDDPALSDRILAACRHFYTDTFAERSGSSAAAKATTGTPCVA